MTTPSSGKASLSDYRIFETAEFQKRFKKLERNDRVFLESKFKGSVYPNLIRNPRFGVNIKKMRGYKPETLRYRVGKFRLFYSIDDITKIVFVLSIDKRKDAYR